MKNNHEIVIIGGGIFGITASIELTKRKHQVTLLNPDRIPHHLAASTDITKAVRLEYGSDSEYFKMTEICIERFREWNEFFNEKLFHEVGYLMLCKNQMESGSQSYENESYNQLKNAGYTTNRLDSTGIEERFPGVNSKTYIDANYNPVGGYVESGRLVEVLANYAKSIGVQIIEGQTAESLNISNGQLQGVNTKEGMTYNCGHAIVAAGPNTPYLLPELKPYMRSTGHPVFWIKPFDPKPFTPPNLSVFAADISNSGWYGFPVTTTYGVVKVARHSDGVQLHPDEDDRQVYDHEIKDLRNFLKATFPALEKAPLVYTRRCLYIDTLDGHFWIDNHPEIKGLTVSSGGSGHGLKMAPLLGEMTADAVEGKTHQFSERYRWRHLVANTVQAEEARHLDKGILS